MDGVLIVAHKHIPAMSAPSVQKVRDLEAELLKLPQGQYDTNHVLHAGMYARTLITPPYTLITGALIKIPTILITHGEITAYVGDGNVRLHGYNVLPASAGRRQAVFSHDTDAYYTMIFPTTHKTVEDAEKQFTDEYNLLASHRDEKFNYTVVTGE